jgi:hypothetical protein
VAQGRIELPTPASSGQRSTNELPGHDCDHIKLNPQAKGHAERLSFSRCNLHELFQGLDAAHALRSRAILLSSSGDAESERIVRRMKEASYEPIELHTPLLTVEEVRSMALSIQPDLSVEAFVINRFSM